MTKWLAALLLATIVVTGCATHALLRPVVIDDYPTAHVRIYRAGLRCRIEVITPTTTIFTIPTSCAIAPHRAAP